MQARNSKSRRNDRIGARSYPIARDPDGSYADPIMRFVHEHSKACFAYEDGLRRAFGVDTPRKKEQLSMTPSTEKRQDKRNAAYREIPVCDSCRIRKCYTTKERRTTTCSKCFNKLVAH